MGYSDVSTYDPEVFFSVYKVDLLVHVHVLANQFQPLLPLTGSGCTANGMSGGNFKIYLQLMSGMCTTASWIETHSSYCIAWEDSTFWNNVAAGMWRWRLSGTCCGPGPRLVLSTALQLTTFCWLLASSQGF